MSLQADWWKSSDRFTVASVATADDIEALLSTPLAANLVELRLDILLEASIPVSSTLDALAHLPLLLTARCPSEGGKANLSENQRLDLLLQHLSKAAAVDIEVRNLPAFSEVVTAAQLAKVPVIGSFHDFEKTPDLSCYQDVLRKATEGNADIFKGAARLHSVDDLKTLVALFPGAALPVAAMGMGALGPASRLILAQHGSLLNYGYVTGTPTAPGQWPASLLKEAIALSPRITP